MSRVDDLRTRLKEWQGDTMDKFDRQEPNIIRSAEYAATIATINNILQMIDQIKQEHKIREGYYRTEN